MYMFYRISKYTIFILSNYQENIRLSGIINIGVYP